MKISEVHSHLNGLEFLMARKPGLLAEIKTVIQKVDGKACRTKISKEKRMKGKKLYSPPALNAAFENQFSACKPAWKKDTNTYYVCADERINRQIISLPPEEQKNVIENSGFEPFRSYNETDFVKDRVAVEVQFGKYSFVAYDLFVKHMSFFVADKIDLGVEIIPMKALQAEMSSGPSYFERELHNLIRQRRGIPAVPLIMIGVEP